MRCDVDALKRFYDGLVIPATPLALDAGRRFDEESQRVLMRYYLSAGAGGIATAVHTTQFAIRAPEVGLFEPVLRVVRDEAAAYEQFSGRPVFLVSGVCGPVDQAVAEASVAKKLGYDAALISPGGLGALSEDALIGRAEAIAQIIPIIGFYLQPAAGGRVFSYDFWARLCGIDNLIGIKCAPFNRYGTIDVMRAAALSQRAGQIALYTGNDDAIITDLLTTWRFHDDKGRLCEKAFVGGLLGHWCVWTRAVCDMFEKIRREKKAEAIDGKWLTIAQEVTDMNAALFDAAHCFAGCIPGLHTVLSGQGLMKTTLCLDKNETLSPGQADEIARVSARYPWHTDDAFVRKNLPEWRAGRFTAQN